MLRMCQKGQPSASWPRPGGVGGGGRVEAGGRGPGGVGNAGVSQHDGSLLEEPEAQERDEGVR